MKKQNADLLVVGNLIINNCKQGGVISLLPECYVDRYDERYKEYNIIEGDACIDAADVDLIDHVAATGGVSYVCI